VKNSLLIATLCGLVGCASPGALDGDDPDGIGGKADGATLALEGTRAGYGVLRLLNDGEGTTFAFLDDTVALDRRAAENLIAHRDGPDGVFGTADDDLFDTVAEVDAVRWVGPSALATLQEFARLNDYVPGDDQVLGTFDGVEFTYLQAERVLSFSNEASPEALSEASVPSRAVTSILDARPIPTVADLADLYWVGPRTLEHLQAAVAPPAPEGDPLCETNDDCADGFRCTGRPDGFEYGKCRDTTNYPGFQDPCSVDADCNPHLICIAETVYGRGYCADEWMRDTFTMETNTPIPPVAQPGPMSFELIVFGQASVPEDILVTLDLEHTDPSSLWIGLEPPTGQGPVTLWDGATETGPLPSMIIDRAIYRDDMVNGAYYLLVQNVEGRGEGTVRGFSMTVTSRWD